MAGPELLLDSSIRLWVVLPIVFITFFVGVLRHYVTQLIHNEKKVDLQQVSDSQVLLRSRILRENGKYLPKQSFAMRKHYFNNPETGFFKKVKRKVIPKNPMTDTSMLTDMMKGNLTNVLPMILIGGWINWAFSGFVTNLENRFNITSLARQWILCSEWVPSASESKQLIKTSQIAVMFLSAVWTLILTAPIHCRASIAKVPFPLTLRFKPMLQRGIELISLDASWVSSASWYFLNVFGLRSMYTLILGQDNAADQSRIMQDQMTGAAMAMPPDPNKAFKSEWEALEIVEHKWALENVEEELMCQDLNFRGLFKNYSKNNPVLKSV